MNFIPVCKPPERLRAAFSSYGVVSTFLFISLLLQRTGSFVSGKSEELQLFVSPSGTPFAGALRGKGGFKGS